MFLPLYGLVAYYFSNRMVRLIIFLGPVAACLVGVCVGYVIEDMHRVMKYVEPEEEKPNRAEMSSHEEEEEGCPKFCREFHVQELETRNR